MSSYTQENRLIAIDTPLGKDVLLLEAFHGVEGISMPFSFDLDLVSLNHNISFADIVGKNVTISVILRDETKRFFNGVVSRFSQGKGGGTAEGDPLSYYRATMVPWFWLLRRTADSRIFQNASVLDIVDDLLKEKHKQYSFGNIKMDYKVLAHGNYDKREYCVQYRETDFNFISRLLEEEGIYYFFQHEDGKHTMVIADSPQEHKPVPTQQTADYQATEGAWLDQDVITGLERTQEIRPAKYALNDFNFTIPNTDLTVNVPSMQKLGPGEREIYDYPGAYAKRNEGDRLVRIRMEEEEAQITRIDGSSTCRAFTTGYRFTLSHFYRSDMNGKDYVLASIDHEASQPWKKDSEFAYTNRFTCTPFDVPFRPVRQNPKPFVRGAQTAIVVGPKGEEIYTDEHGRVKVQFHWDREGKKDDNSSCWIRVSQVWAGGGWGAIHIPRIGQEVIVDFLEGDPDRPIITGRVYNASQTPPYGLPANATQSGLRSRSSKGGSADNYNEIRMEDKKGAEQILVHAERNMDTSVEVDESLDVGGNRKVHVKGSFTENIDSGETRTVNAGAKETINGGMTQTINGGEIRTVNGGVTESINGGETRTINGGATETIVGGETRTVSGGLTETINGAFTQTSSSGATISSPGAITIKGDGGVNIIAAGGTKIIDTALASFGGSRLEFYDAQNKVLIENAQVTAIKTDVVLTLSTGIAMNKIDRAGFVSKKEGAKFTEELINIGKATQRILDAGLTMIGL